MTGTGPETTPTPTVATVLGEHFPEADERRIYRAANDLSARGMLATPFPYRHSWEVGTDPVELAEAEVMDVFDGDDAEGLTDLDLARLIIKNLHESGMLILPPAAEPAQAQ